MGVTNRLVFDPTDANTVAASSSVGAFVRAGTDGTLIGHTAGALNVNISNSDFDIRDLVYTQDSVTAHQGGTWTVSVDSLPADVDIRDLAHTQDSVKIGDGTDFLAVNADGSINSVVSDGGGSITVDASDLDVRDIVHTQDSIRLGDGSALITSTLVGAKQSLDVNVANSISTSDAALANTAIENTATSIGTTAVSVVSSSLSDRKYLFLANNGNRAMFIGKSGVTTANGFPMMPGERVELRAGASITVQAIGGAGAATEDLRAMELA
jgi:hypothetical protein